VPVHFLNTESQTVSADPPPPHTTFPPPLAFFLVRFCFWAFLGKGSSKTPHIDIDTYVLAKSPCQKKIPKNRQKFRCSMSVFPRFALFYRVFGCFSAMGVQKHYEKRFAKQVVLKSFCQKFDQKSKTDFFSIFFNHVFGFWAFLGEGTTKKKKSDPGPFLRIRYIFYGLWCFRTPRAEKRLKTNREKNRFWFVR
jgi:hypothetical protein